MGYDKTMASFEASLKDLQVQYLDLFLIHWPLPFPGADWKPLVTESWRALERLYDEGAVRAIGVCNFLPQHLLHVLKTANTVPMIDQFEFHPGYPQYETLQFCQSRRHTGGGMESPWQRAASGGSSGSGACEKIRQKSGANLSALLPAK